MRSPIETIKGSGLICEVVLILMLEVFRVIQYRHSWEVRNSSLLRRWSYYWGGPITEVVLLLRWSYYWGGSITEVVLLLRWTYYWDGPITEVVSLLRWSHYWDGPITEVVPLLRWSHYWDGPITEVVPLLRWSHYWGGPITEMVCNTTFDTNSVYWVQHFTNTSITWPITELWRTQDKNNWGGGGGETTLSTLVPVGANMLIHFEMRSTWIPPQGQQITISGRVIEFHVRTMAYWLYPGKRYGFKGQIGLTTTWVQTGYRIADTATNNLPYSDAWTDTVRSPHKGHIGTS